MNSVTYTVRGLNTRRKDKKGQDARKDTEGKGKGFAGPVSNCCLSACVIVVLLFRISSNSYSSSSSSYSSPRPSCSS